MYIFETKIGKVGSWILSKVCAVLFHFLFLFTSKNPSILVGVGINCISFYSLATLSFSSSFLLFLFENSINKLFFKNSCWTSYWRPIIFVMMIHSPNEFFPDEILSSGPLSLIFYLVCLGNCKLPLFFGHGHHECSMKETPIKLKNWYLFTNNRSLPFHEDLSHICVMLPFNNFSHGNLDWRKLQPSHLILCFVLVKNL